MRVSGHDFTAMAITRDRVTRRLLDSPGCVWSLQGEADDGAGGPAAIRDARGGRAGRLVVDCHCNDNVQDDHRM